MTWNYASPLGFFSPAALLEFIILLSIDELQMKTLGTAQSSRSCHKRSPAITQEILHGLAAAETHPAFTLHTDMEAKSRSIHKKQSNVEQQVSQ
ncbi:hypothetical protein VIGAN_11169700 [Vigna angularis var. angularis]|uniref:Uncharacterized protein n=1 Tax=Vigna angularis var. angularis TaxID=157739 RepID=A0A0S3TAN4_PHAAN|nr:hypothetical protein VIGAN_11169700 [Vigna angularis var. angularis]